MDEKVVKENQSPKGLFDLITHYDAQNKVKVDDILKGKGMFFDQITIRRDVNYANCNSFDEITQASQTAQDEVNQEVAALMGLAYKVIGNDLRFRLSDHVIRIYYDQSPEDSSVRAISGFTITQTLAIWIALPRY